MDLQRNERKVIAVKEIDDEVKQRITEHFSGVVADVSYFENKMFVMPTFYKDCMNYIKNMNIDFSCIVQGGPRCGTTWLAVTCRMLLNDLNWDDKDLNIDGFIIGLYPSSPGPGCTEEALASALTKHRCIQTHIPLSFLPDDILQRSKVIHIARDPRDAAVSFYHLNVGFNMAKFNGDFKTFWNLFIAGEMYLTPFFPRVHQAWAKRNHPNLLFLFYEEMLEDLPSVVRRIAKFLDRNYSDERINDLCDLLKFDKWKNKPINPNLVRTDLVEEMCESKQFFRKGKSGQWKEYFDEEMRQQAAMWMSENLAYSDIQHHLPKNWNEQ